MIFGGDFSVWDPILDWSQHPWKYAFIKVSEGVVEDTKFDRQWSAARDHVWRGGYHFFRPLVSWRSAGEKFMQLMDRDGLGELPPVLDLEVTNGVAGDQVCYMALEWLRYIHRESGQRPIVYTAPFFSDYVNMFRYVDFADYPLWMATYPWDKITKEWTEAQRRKRLLEVVAGTYPIAREPACRPWTDVGRSVVLHQFTGKYPPDAIPGYPLGVKEAVDVNIFHGNEAGLMSMFSLKPLKGDDNVSTKPITWTALLLAGQKANLRNAPGVSSTTFVKTITAPLSVNLPFQGTGQKQYMDGYYWAEVVLPEPGWIAFTTSFIEVKWLTDHIGTQRRAVRSVTFYDDGSTEELFPR